MILFQSAVVVGGGGFLQEEVTSEVIASGVEENLAVAEDMEEVNTETRESFRGGLRVQLDRKEIVPYRQAKMEVVEVDGKVGEDLSSQLQLKNTIIGEENLVDGFFSFSFLVSRKASKTPQHFSLVEERGQ